MLDLYVLLLLVVFGLTSIVAFIYFSIRIGIPMFFKIGQEAKKAVREGFQEAREQYREERKLKGCNPGR